MIEQTIAKINEANKVLLKDPPNDFRVMAGFELARVTAKREIGELTKTLSQEIMNIAVPVFVNGKQAADFVAEMAALTPSATVDLDNIYKSVYDAVKPSIGRENIFGITQFMLLVTTLRELAVDNGLAAIEMPKFEEPLVMTSEKVLKDTIFKYSNQAVGAELAAEYARKQTAEQAVISLVDGAPITVFPVFLLNSTAAHQSALARTFKRSLDITLTAPNEVTEASAVEALKSIKKNLKKTKE